MAKIRNKGARCHDRKQRRGGDGTSDPCPDPSCRSVGTMRSSGEQSCGADGTSVLGQNSREGGSAGQVREWKRRAVCCSLLRGNGSRRAERAARLDLGQGAPRLGRRLGPREWRMTMDADVAKGGRARLSCSNRCDAEVASTPRGSRGNEAPFKEIRASSRRLPRVLHLFSRDGSVKGGSPLPRRNLHRQSSVLHSPRPWHEGCNTGLT